MKEITLTWEGPFDPQKVVKENNQDNEQCDFGIYQIYGPHSLYTNKKRDAESVLLYIGMTVGSTFSGRVNEHGFWNTNSEEYEIYLGRVENISDDNIWEQYITNVEKVLINKYAPSYNSHYCGDLKSRQMKGTDWSDYKIINIGEKADLDAEVLFRDVIYTK